VAETDRSFLWGCSLSWAAGELAGNSQTLPWDPYRSQDGGSELGMQHRGLSQTVCVLLQLGTGRLRWITLKTCDATQEEVTD